MRNCHILLLLSTLLPIPAYSAGPAVIAKADRQLWPDDINTISGFDKASRASILTYMLTVKDMQAMSDADMLEAFKIKSVNRDSVNKWLDKELALSTSNYKIAAKNCEPSDWTCVGSIAKSGDLLAKAQQWHTTLPAKYHAWHDKLTDFAHAYSAEQLRLAALFPKVSSEIDLFNANEWNGDNFPDRTFFLTFDDGPTGGQGDTDKVLTMLANNKKTAVFFVLGENLEKRLHKTNPTTVANLYKNQCVASHGWEHQSHAKWEQWQESVTRTQDLLKTTFQEDIYSPLFRPPYGQRNADSGVFFQERGLQIALWNLDSQDWNKHVEADDIIDRIVTLMLIKRHGVLLFHDVHAKAEMALPVIIAELDRAIEWGDCHKLPRKARVG
jgi:peptidoglycan/xylan/chitin deacetylase (PgdA/CDA1 family)